MVKLITHYSLLITLFLAVPLIAADKTYRQIDVKDGGSISGQVIWEGDIPKEAFSEVPVNMQQQSPCRCKKIAVNRLTIDEKTKGVANCVISIARIDRGKKLLDAGINLTTGKEAILDQIGCRYVPEVMIVPLGTELLVTSSDATSHNVNARLGTEQKFNLLITRKGAKEHGPKTSVGKKTGVISLSCNAGHPWMSGYVHVVDHPYHALTDKEGRYELKDVPPGKYKLTCWHADWTPKFLRDTAGNVTEVQYGRAVELTENIEVKPKESSTVTFKLLEAPATEKKQSGGN